MRIVCVNKLGIVWYHYMHQEATLAFVSGVLSDLRSKLPDVRYSYEFI
jgi:hypothetical protein